MRELGYVDGKNLVIEWRSADGNNECLPGLAAELVNLKVDVIVTSGTPASLAVQKSSSTIPLVITGVADPVGSGLVKSLGRPGGTTTGLSNMVADLGAKELEMLRSMAPNLSSVAVLVNPTNVSHAPNLKRIQTAALTVNVTIVPVEARRPQEIDSAFSTMIRQKAEAFIVLIEPLFQQQKGQIVELAAKHRLPFIAASSEYVEAGGLMSYGPDPREMQRRAATSRERFSPSATTGRPLLRFNSSIDCHPAPACTRAAALAGAAAVSLPGGLILKAKTDQQRGQRSRAACARVKRSDGAEYQLAWGSANQRAGEISTKDACV
jgi:putative ABC transport system substrate-binding protein